MANPLLDSAFHNRLVRHGIDIYQTRLRQIFEQWTARGFLPGTEKPTPEEELADLLAQEPMLQQVLMTTQDAMERLDATRKLMRLEELRNGTNPESSPA